MNPALLGALRGLGLVVLVAVLTYVGDASHLTFISNPWIEALIASAALALEHQIEDKTGKALFGAAKTK